MPKTILVAFCTYIEANFIDYKKLNIMNIYVFNYQLLNILWWTEQSQHNKVNRFCNSIVFTTPQADHNPIDWDKKCMLD